MAARMPLQSIHHGSGRSYEQGEEEGLWPVQVGHASGPKISEEVMELDYFLKLTIELISPELSIGLVAKGLGLSSLAQITLPLNGAAQGRPKGVCERHPSTDPFNQDSEVLPSAAKAAPLHGPPTGWEQDILTHIPDYFGITRASLGSAQQELPLISGPGRALSRARCLSQPWSHHMTCSKRGAHQQLPE